VDAGMLAARFGMNNLDSWAQTQILKLIQLSKSTPKENWDGETLVALASYMRRTRIITYRRDIMGMVRMLMCPTAALYSPEQVYSGLDACLDIYKNSSAEFLTKDPVLFGYVFAIILLRGPESFTWTKDLTREDRTILYAAYAGLTRLDSHKDLDTSWIKEPTQVKDVCSRLVCSSNFWNAWSIAFEYIGALDSLIPLEDMHEIVEISHSRRWSFARSCRWRCDSQCGQKTLDKFDSRLERLLCGLTEKYKYFSR
jgi:hypothetical protein